MIGKYYIYSNNIINVKIAFISIDIFSIFWKNNCTFFYSKISGKIAFKAYYRYNLL